VKTLIPARATKAIDQQASGLQPGGYYVRIDDRSTFTQTLYDANASALSMSTVYACVRVLAEDIAKLPFVLYRRLPNGGKERATDHELYPVLHDQPNPDMTSFVWRELVMSHLATWGNHYSEKVYDSMGRLQLWPIRPDRMEVRYGPDGRKIYIYLSPAGTRTEMRPESVFHIAGLSSNGLVGLSPIALHAKTLRLAETMQEFGQSFMGNGARPATILTHPATLSPDAISRLATQMDELRGSKNSGKTVVLEEGLSFTEVGVPPEDAQYIETRKFQREIIATEIFRMKPHKVGILEHATFSNIEHESLDHVGDTLMPWAVRLEQECKSQLLYNDPDVFAEILFDALLRGDAKSRAEALAIRWQHGTLTPDEWRALENENPLPDGIGKQTYIAVNYARASAEVPPAVDPNAPPLLTAVKSAEVRCDKGHLLAEMATPPYRFTCRQCKTVAEAA
jgi:HK97 family phage portal protein